MTSSIEGLIRDQAVRNVDARYGYTCEFSSSPERHVMEYDEEEERLWAQHEPYRDVTRPGRLDVNGVEWWACDPYPTWYRWEDGQLFTNHARWPADDPHAELAKALAEEAEAEKMLAKARQRLEVAREAVENHGS